MRVLVTGATGFIGSAIVRELMEAGCMVLGLARSDESAAKLAAAGVEAVRGSLEDPDSLARAVAASDGVIHTAFHHDFSNIIAAGEMDKRAVEAMGEALAGSGRPFIVTSVIGHLPEGRLATEEDVPDPISAVKHRAASESAALSFAEKGVRAVVVRLPHSVHGAGDPWFVTALIRLARSKGVSAYVGDGMNCWNAVHRLDAARLFRMALESAAAGSVLHAIDDEGVPFREIAAVIGRRLGVPTRSVPREEASDHFTWLTHFISADLRASSKLTRSRLGWRPEHPSLLADIDSEAYFA